MEKLLNWTLSAQAVEGSLHHFPVPKSTRIAMAMAMGSIQKFVLSSKEMSSIKCMYICLKSAIKTFVNFSMQ